MLFIIVTNMLGGLLNVTSSIICKSFIICSFSYYFRSREN